MLNETSLVKCAQDWYFDWMKKIGQGFENNSGFGKPPMESNFIFPALRGHVI